MAYFRSLSAVKWPNMIPDAVGVARGYSCYPRHLCEEQLPLLPPPLPCHHPQGMRKPQECQGKGAGGLGRLQEITVSKTPRTLTAASLCKSQSNSVSNGLYCRNPKVYGDSPVHKNGTRPFPGRLSLRNMQQPHVTYSRVCQVYI